MVKKRYIVMREVVWWVGVLRFRVLFISVVVGVRGRVYRVVIRGVW